MKVVSAFVRSEFDWMHLCVLSICYVLVTAHTLYLYDHLFTAAHEGQILSTPCAKTWTTKPTLEDVSDF